MIEFKQNFAIEHLLSKEFRGTLSLITYDTACKATYYWC